MVPPPEEAVSNAWTKGIFDGKVVFATGGAGSIVSVQVQALVQLGANACIIGRNKEKTERVAQEIARMRPGARVLGLAPVDVKRIENVEKAVTQCVQELGGIDFVIAGAAGNFLAPITQLSDNAMRSVIDIDLVGSWNALKATYPHLATSAQKHRSDGTKSSANGTGGRIIFVSATMGYTGNQLQTHAIVAKAGVDALSVQCAIELGPRGITSNVIAPGPIAGTEGVDRLYKDGVGVGAAKAIPSGRLGTVKDIADATVFLFSDAGNWINGATLVVDGGAWRVPGAGAAHHIPYPDFILSDDAAPGTRSKLLGKL